MPQWELVHVAGEPQRSTTSEGHASLRWVFADLPGASNDAPPGPTLLIRPHLVYSNHGAWGELADWYGRHVAPRIRASREVEEKARELVTGIDDRRERISRIYRFVTNEIRYVGLEFGEHRYRPFSADWVLTQKMGDCKDTAGLLVALYTSLGIPARMVMTRTSDLGPVVAELAVLQDFNHAIAYLPEDDLWLDGTAAGHDPYPPPGLDQSAWVLVVDGPRSEPQTTPYVGTGSWGYNYTLTERDSTAFDLVIRTEDTGEAATRRRGLFAGRRNRSVFSRWLQGQFPGAEMVGEADVALALGKSPAVMEVRAVLDRSALLAAGGLKTYPGSFELDTELTPTDSRSTPLKLPVRPDLTWTVTVATDGSTPTPPPPVRLESAWGSLEIDAVVDGSDLRVSGVFRLRPLLVAAEDARSLRTFLVDVRRALERRIEVR
jgi:transglutaminase-like putative cysteine protease